MPSDFYQFTAKNLQGKEVSMSEFEGKTLLVVNTASKCGLTPQYEGLENLYQKYKGRGLEILGFPCNQFGDQEPGDSSEISEFCEINYGVSFRMFDKVLVNGKNAHPLWKYLQNQKRGLLGKSIKWNFTKFLISPTGKVVDRYNPTREPASIERDVVSQLNVG